MIQDGNLQAAASAVLLETLTALTGGNNYQATNKDNANEALIYDLNSNLFPCVCVAMYETILSPSFYEDSLNDGEEEFYYNTVDLDDWKKALTIAAEAYIQNNVIESLRNYGCIKIEATGIWSPKHYNYHTDELNMKVMMDANWKSLMKEHVESWRGRKNVESYIRDNWYSCSGFVSFMPKSLDEVLSEDDEDRQLASYLTLAMLVEGTLKPAGDIMECLYYDIESDSNRINVIEEYYNNSLEAEKILKLWYDDLSWNELYWRLRDKIGHPWSHDKESGSLEGKKDYYSFNADSDGKRLLFWAVRKGYTVDDLYSLAA